MGGSEEGQAGHFSHHRAAPDVTLSLTHKLVAPGMVTLDFRPRTNLRVSKDLNSVHLRQNVI